MGYMRIKRKRGPQVAPEGTPEEKPFTLEVFDPTGPFEITEVHAPRLPDLNGKTICELGNGKWEAHRILPAIRDLLRKRFPDIKMIPYTEFPYAYEIDDDAVAALVKKKGGQGAILASAS